MNAWSRASIPGRSRCGSLSPRRHDPDRVQRVSSQPAVRLRAPLAMHRDYRRGVPEFKPPARVRTALVLRSWR